MALKDLVAKKSTLTEEAIEVIVSKYARYDADELEIVFTPAAASLPHKGKVLVYLVALQGWKFVVDEAVPDNAKPAELEELLGIQGGSLRPILKNLKDQHLLASKQGKYSVRTSNLEAIKAELDPTGETQKLAKPRKRKKGSKSKAGTSKNSPATKKNTSSANEQSSKFSAWIDAGFFDTPCTLSDVQKRFHKEAIIIPRTSIPGMLLKAVREKRLERDKEEVAGKVVWVYRTKKS